MTHVYIDLSRLCLTKFTTGIQRVAREIVLRMLKDPSLEVTLLADMPSHTEWRVLPHDAFTEFYTKGTGSPYGTGKTVIVRPREIESGAVFFDIDSAWNMPMHRSWLFPILREHGVTVVPHLYDLIPVTEPQYFYSETTRQFLVWVTAVLQNASHIICNAGATKAALAKLCGELECDTPPCTVIPLGADFKQGGKAEQAPLPEGLTPEKYVLMVGTIEPRKNHALLLDAVKPLSERGIKVVFAGRIGWNMDAFQKKMAAHPQNGTDFFFFEGPTDAVIRALYANALAVVFPTKNEGFGLPVIEAYQHGTPVLASDIPVLREVGGELADYFDNTSVDSLVAAVDRLLAGDTRAKKKEAIAAYRPRTWDATAADMAAALAGFSQKTGTVPAETRISQMVVLTARNDDLLRTLPYLDAFLPFIERLLVCCPERNIAELREKWHGRIQLSFFTDEELLGGAPLPKDHTRRNFFLRCLLMEKAPLDDVFIMTDDDYRPLLPLTQEFFLKDGRMRGYYCYDLREWHGTQGNYTSYDLSMFRTRDFLTGEGLPALQYSSHQPQIIDRRIYLEMLAQYPHISGDGLDEWSTYFNYGIAVHPDRFAAVPYTSIGWPGAITDWTLWCQPSGLYFENFYDALYENGRIFADLSREYNAGTVASENMEKVQRWITELGKQQQTSAALAMFRSVYHSQYHMMPELSLCEDGDGAAVFRLPKLICIPAGAFVRLRLMTDDTLRRKGAVLRYGVQNTEGRFVIPQQEIRLADLDSRLHPELVLPAPAGLLNGALVLEYDCGEIVRGSTACLVR